MTYIPYDSRDPACKSPFGAVRQGTSVHFKVKLPRSIGCSYCRLFVVKDGGYCENRYDMYWCGMDENGQYEWWEYDFAPQDASLYWYRFDLTVKDGFCSIFKCGESAGQIGCGLDCWQLTVFDKDFSTPDWLRGGIIYQIFPDRFNNSGKEKKDVYTDRIMHKSWFEKQRWQPDPDGEYRNNDYFGGDLQGIEQKLDYIASLGVSCIYLNPIFEAHSNHRYNTASYERIDPLLGDVGDFQRLCMKADKLGIKIILDGVFSHSGSDSVYFNREGRYKTVGAFNSMESEYFEWYKFFEWPDKYDCWWGFRTLPDIDENNRSYLDYITGEGGILQKWIEKGASGWRLDVADELPNHFLEELRRAVKDKSPDALILGEVWEDASNKISYNSRRKFLLGRQLDTVMNYPFRRAVIDYIRESKSQELLDTVMRICENYPKPCVDILMNCLSTHDTERIVSAAAFGYQEGRDRQTQNGMKLSRAEKERVCRLVRLASVVQYTLPGVPSVYYGDEAAMEGGRDPFNRGTFPWDELRGIVINNGHKTDPEVLEICGDSFEHKDEERDTELTEWFRRLGTLRRSCDELCDGEFVPLRADGGFLQYMRAKGDHALLVTVNKGSEPVAMTIPDGYETVGQLMGQEKYLSRDAVRKIVGSSEIPSLEGLTKCGDEQQIPDDGGKSQLWLQGMDYRIIRLKKSEDPLN